MDGATTGLIGGITGALLGVAGGVFGTYCSIRNTQGPIERAFVVRGALAIWALVVALLAVLFILPWSYWLLAGIVYLALLLGAITYLNRGQQRARARERSVH